MTNIQVIEQTLADGCQLVRPRKNQLGQYDSKSFTEGGNKKGWVYLDTFTASAVKQVYDQLNDQNKAKFTSLTLTKMIDVTWKLVN